MSRNQQIAFTAFIVFVFTVLSIGVIATMKDQRHAEIREDFEASDAAANRVVALYENAAPTVPQCYVNYGAMTYQVDCNSQSMVDAKRRYDQKVQEQIENFDKTP